MNEAFDVIEYAAYLRRRWRVPVVACGTAVAVVLAVSLLLPRRYTATATIVIEPPAGNDMRAATAVSPVYLESLRTYERFAGSDSLFQRAAERFHLQTGSQAIESLKQRVLKVEKVRD
ncbi:MAG: Wzz/FepE/Etk N-terminal domain-containing protein, partial [Bryobacteraceae bacterium]